MSAKQCKQHIKVNEYDAFKAFILTIPDKDRFDKVTQVYKDYFPSIPNSDAKLKLLQNLATKFANFSITAHDGVWFNPEDIDFINSLDNTKTQKLFFCLICQMKMNPHPKGWIAFDWPKILKYAFTKDESKEIVLYDFNVCYDYGFDTQVVGKNNPMLCFKIAGHTSDVSENAILIKSLSELKKLQKK